jgi:hypothetical protein
VKAGTSLLAKGDGATIVVETAAAIVETADMIAAATVDWVVDVRSKRWPTSKSKS